MPVPAFTSESRFRLDVLDYSGRYSCSLPYNNMQGEWMMGASGEQIRFTVPYRDNPWLTPDKLVPGKHIIFLVDRKMGVGGGSHIRFGGPLQDVTASSQDGTLGCAATSMMFVLKKRLLKVDKSWAVTPATTPIQDLMTYTNGVRSIFKTGMGTNIYVVGSTVQSLEYKAADQPTIMDLIDDVASLGTGVDYYVEWSGDDAAATVDLVLHGGRINPSGIAYALEFGASPSKGALPQLSSFALTKTAQTISNQANVISSTGLVGEADDTTSQTALNQLYQTSEQGVEGLINQADVDARAALNVAQAPYGKDIPQIVLKGLDPLIHFTYGDKIELRIDDGWASYSDIVRVVGWQSTFGRQDQMTNVVYLNDLSEVS